MSREVWVEPNNPVWKELFVQESRCVLEALGSNAVAVHHIGSTAIPTIVAKPIVDVLVEVCQIEEVDVCNGSMEVIGYEVMGEYGIPTRRYFRKNNENGVRLFHVHVFPRGSDQVIRHIAFRDFMNAHPHWAKEYSELKLALVDKHSESIIDYHEGKSDFIRHMDGLAAQWRRTGSII